MKNEMNTHSMVTTSEDALREYMVTKVGEIRITELYTIISTRRHDLTVAQLHPDIADENVASIEKHLAAFDVKLAKREAALKSKPATRKRRGTKA